MYRHIVVAIDGSNNASKALGNAIELAKFCHARLTLLHVASLRDLAVEGVGLLGTGEMHEQAFRDGTRILDQALQQALAAEVSQVQTHMAESWEGGNSMADILIEYTDENQGDLIIVGTHGRRGLAHLLLGSFAETVLRQANCPVMVVRNTEPR